MQFHELTRTGFVSVWSGAMKSAREFDLYLVKQFPSDFGFKIDPRAKVEGKSVPSLTEIATLVSGFSRTKAFEARCVEAATAKHILSALSMLVIFDFEYDERLALNPSALMTFIGVFEYPGFT